MTSISATSSKNTRSGGRPKFAPDEVRKPYGVRLSKRELDLVRLRAEEAGVDLSTFCREAILNIRPAQRAVPAINRKTFHELHLLARALVIIAQTPELSGHGELLREVMKLQLMLKLTRRALLGITDNGAGDL